MLTYNKFGCYKGKETVHCFKTYLFIAKKDKNPFSQSLIFEKINEIKSAWIL